MKYVSTNRGVSLVEVIITAAIVALVFGALMVGAQSMLQLVSRSKAKAAALSVASTQMEYLRSFSYDALGTIGGVPDGTVPQNATTTLNGITFNIRTLIQYVDDSADGSGAADENGILADYKQIKVEVSWQDRGETRSMALTSNVVPRGIETTEGGGTIRVNVFDENVQPVAGAEVRFVNDTATSSIDTIRYTNPDGVAYLAGAPAVSDYHISVTQTGYSTDGTYQVTTTNPNPETPPIAVLSGQVSTMNFQIDELSTVTITTHDVPSKVTNADTFTSSAGIISFASTTLQSGSVVLADTAGVYDSTGTVTGTTTTPTTINHWYKATAVASTSANTTLRLFVTYDTGSGIADVPESALPGNGVGFTTFPVDLTDLSGVSYPALGLRAELTTNTSTDTPALHEWSLTYVESQAVVSGVDLALIGTKTIGTRDDGSDVLKHVYTGVTDGAGVWEQSDVEFDAYDLLVTDPSYVMYESCPSSPLSIAAGTATPIDVVVGPAVTNYLRILVSEVDGSPIADATVQLENSGVDEAEITSLCGQAFFGTGLYADDGYLLTVSATGYGTKQMASTTISGSTSMTVILD